MKTFLAVLLLEVLTTGFFYHRISGDTQDGDISLGILFWLMVCIYVSLDLFWVLILLWLNGRW
jgi:hypothetical protein